MTFFDDPSPISECEPDYQFHPFIGEPICAITSTMGALLMINLFGGISGKAPRSRRAALAGAFATVSSVIYHITLMRWSLCLDQLALLLIAVVALEQPFLLFAAVGPVLDFRLGAVCYAIPLGFTVRRIANEVSCNDT